jgi:hypothetical protein
MVINEENVQDFCPCPNQCEIINMLVKLAEQKSPLSAWIDSHDLMKLLHISKRTLFTLRTTGIIPFSRISNKIYYKIEDVQRILQDNYTMYKIQNYERR